MDDSLNRGAGMSVTFGERNHSIAVNSSVKGSAVSSFVCYLRVSTSEQGISGLGLSDQERACREYALAQGGQVIACFTEVESGKVNGRPQLAAAFRHADLAQATVVFAKLDRLSRNAAFLLNLKDSGVRFAALDCPRLETMDLGMRAIFAQHERETISARTKAALAVVRAKGEKRLGNPNGFKTEAAERGRVASARARSAQAVAFAKKFGPIISELEGDGILALADIASALNQRSFKSVRGGAWSPKTVQRLLHRLGQSSSRGKRHERRLSRVSLQTDLNQHRTSIV
jgi:DNA invertase Pin-like site-specific DNA recombinase